MNLSQKYKPTNLQELILPEENKQKIMDCIKKRKPLLLAGPPGVGKTSAVYAITKEFDYDIIDINSSDSRNKIFLEDMLKRVKIKGWKPQLFFFDEMDNMRATGYMYLNKILTETKHPIILAANEYWKIPMDTRKRCQMLQIKEPTLASLVKLVKRIGEKEKIKPHYSRITSGDDYRTAISKAFYNSSNFTRDNSFKDVDSCFKYGKIPNNLPLIWLIDNLSKYYHGKTLIKQLALIKASDKYKMEELLKSSEKPLKNGRVQTPYFIKRRNMFRRKE